MATSETSTEPPLYPPTPFWWRIAIGMGVLLLALCSYSLYELQGGPFLSSREGSGVQNLQIHSGLGVVCLIGLVACFSRNLRAVRWSTISWGLALQVLLGLFVLKTDLGRELFQGDGFAITKLIDFSEAGSKLVFGNLADSKKMENALNLREGGWQILALNIVGPVIFISTFFSVLYYLGVLQFVVRLFARGMMYLLRTSGAETLSGVANVFMGQTEAPLIVKPYIKKMTQSELLTLMVGGLATISGGMMVVYINIISDGDPQRAQDVGVAILTTSVMAAPCALYLSKLMYPETGQPETLGTVRTTVETEHANIIDAAASGASGGMKLAINVLAMLIAFYALLAMINYLLGELATGQSLWTTLQQADVNLWVLNLVILGSAFFFLCLGFNRLLVRWGKSPLQRWFGTRSFPQYLGNVLLVGVLFLLFVLVVDRVLAWSSPHLQLETIFGFLFSPLALLMGVREPDWVEVGNLLGIKLAANEFVAFVQLQRLTTIDERTHRLVTFALTGFANFGSVGILIGGIGTMAEERRSDLARLGFRALFVGFLVTVINAAVAGVLLAPSE